MLAPITDPTITSVFAAKTRITEDGTVEGYASLFGEIDQARDMVVRGAFRASLAVRGPRRVPMLFQHDPSEPVGVWLDLREDATGLYARGRLIPDVARARANCCRFCAPARSTACRSVSGRRKRASIRGRACAVFLRSISGKFRSSPSRCSRERACAR